MKSDLITLLIIVPILFLTMSSQAQGARQLAKEADTYYVAGDYLNAASKAIEALRAESSNRLAFEVLDKSYNPAVFNTEQEIRKTEAKAATFTGDQTVGQWNWIVDRYNELIRMQREAELLGSVYNKKSKKTLEFKSIDYTAALLAAEDALSDAKQSAAQMHYERGERLMKNGTRATAKDAAKAYKAAYNYVSGYKDAYDKYKEARKAGTSRVAFIPFENKSGKPQLGAVEDVITDMVISKLMQDRDAMEFIDLLSRDQLDVIMNEQNLMRNQFMNEESAVQYGKMLGVQVLITGKISSIVYDAKPTMQSNVSQSKQVVVQRQAYYDSDGKKKYKDIHGTVHCIVTQYTRKAQASIIGSYQILDVETAKVISSNSFNKTIDWSHTWGRYSGDERALSREFKQLCTVEEKYPPNQEAMTNMAAEGLAETLSKSLSWSIR